jgi:hypothetical protein
MFFLFVFIMDKKTIGLLIKVLDGRFGCHVSYLIA